MALSIDNNTSIVSVADLTQLKAQSVPPGADLCWVEGIGLYRYDPNATGDQEPFVVIPGSGNPTTDGRWVLDDPEDDARLSRQPATDTDRLLAWAERARALTRAVGDKAALTYNHIAKGSLNLSGVEVIAPAGLEIAAEISVADNLNVLARIGAVSDMPSTFYAVDENVLPGTDRLKSAALLTAYNLKPGDLIVLRRTATRGATQIGEMNAVKGIRDGIIYCEHPWLYDGIYNAAGAQTQVGGYPVGDGAEVAFITPRHVSFTSPLTLSFARTPFESQGTKGVPKIPVGMDVWMPAWSEIKARAVGATGGGVRVYGGYGTQVELWGAACTSKNMDDGTIGLVTGGRNVRVYLHAGAGRHVVGSGGHDKLGMAIWRFGGEAQGGRSTAALDTHANVMELLVEPGTVFSGGDVQDPNAADGQTFRPGGASIAAYRWRAPHVIGRSLTAVTSLRNGEYVHLIEIGVIDLEDCDHGYRQNEGADGPVVRLARIGCIRGSLRSTWVPALQNQSPSLGRWYVGHAISLLKDTIYRLEVGDIDVTGGAALYIGSKPKPADGDTPAVLGVTFPAGTRLRLGRVRCRRLYRVPAADHNTVASDGSRSQVSALQMLFAIRNINTNVTGLTAESFAAEGYDAALMVGTPMDHVEFGRVEWRNNFTNGFISANIGTLVLGSGEIAQPTQTAATYGYVECENDATIGMLYLSSELRFTGDHQFIFGRTGKVGTIVGTPARLPASFAGFGYRTRAIANFDPAIHTDENSEIWVRTGALTSPGEVWIWRAPATHPDANGTLAGFPNGTRVTDRTTGTSYVKSGGTWTAV
jgi:hypothetical protein